MIKINIDDPDNFQFASSVQKDSKTGITSNRRLLVLKGGHLYYYSNVPKFFNGDPKSLQYFHQLPKGSIDLVNIKYIKSLGNSCTFSIIFDAMFMMERQDIRKTLTNTGYTFIPKNTNQELVWQFTCQNQIIAQKWVGILQHQVDYYVTELNKIHNYFQNINTSNDQQGKNSSSNMVCRNTLKTPWRESKIDRRTYTTQDNSKGFQLPFNTSKSSIQLQQNNFKKKKAEDQKQFPNTYTNEVSLQSYQMSYQQPKIKIEQAFNYSSKKQSNELQLIKNGQY